MKGTHDQIYRDGRCDGRIHFLYHKPEAEDLFRLFSNAPPCHCVRSHTAEHHGDRGGSCCHYERIQKDLQHMVFPKHRTIALPCEYTGNHHRRIRQIFSLDLQRTCKQPVQRKQNHDQRHYYDDDPDGTAGKIADDIVNGR